VELLLSDVVSWVENFIWPFMRIGALLMSVPFYGARTVPVRIRIVLSLLITLAIFPVLPAADPVDPFSGMGLVISLQQIGVGVAMGVLLQFMFAALVMAGHAIAMTMGLGFASAVDPQNGVQVTMVGQFYLTLATLFFLAVDGHLMLLEILVESFTAIPIGGDFLSASLFWNISQYSGQMFVAAIMIALPAMLGVLLVNLGFGVMMRAAPQLNVFAMGFPLTMLTGFALMLYSLHVLLPILTDFTNNTFNLLAMLVN